MRNPGLPAVALAAALAGCGATAARMTPPPTSSPPAGARFEATGAVAFAAEGEGATVSYSPWRVRGPGIDVGWAGGGSWSGQIAGAEVRIAATDGRLTGAGGDVLVQRSGAELQLRGSWAGRSLEIELSRTGLKGTLDGGACTFDLQRSQPDELAGTLGCALPGGKRTSSRGTLRLRGEAVLLPDVLQPQFVLALLSALPL